MTLRTPADTPDLFASLEADAAAEQPAGELAGPAADEAVEDHAHWLPLSQVTGIRLAKQESVDKLAAKLRNMRVPDRIARSVACSVVDPTAVRKRLDAPNVVRLGGAVLYTVEAELWAPAVVPYPGNPRTSVQWQFPAAGEDAEVPMCQVTANADQSHPELLVAAHDVPHLSELLSRNSNAVLSSNPYTSSIAQQGVVRSITVVPMTVQLADDTPQATALTAVDGSSRVTACHDLLGLTPSQCVYPYAQDLAALRNRLKSVLATGKQPTAAEAAALRALIVPATVVVGFEPLDSRVDFLSAVRSLLGRIHVAPPQPWSMSGSLDAQGDSVLHTLVEYGTVGDPKRPGLDAETARWVAGMMTPTEAVAAGFPVTADERFAKVVLTVTDTVLKNSVNDGIRRVTGDTKSPHQRVRVAIAVELALRPVRHMMAPDLIDRVRNALARALELKWMLVQFKNQLDDGAWGYTGRGPEELLAASLEELRVGTGRVARHELAILALWWLAMEELLGRPRRNEIHDWREPSALLDALMSSERGIHVLYRAIVDGRAGVPIRVVDESGNLELDAVGQPLEWTPGELRAEFQVATENEVVAQRAATAEAAAPPAEQVRQGLKDVAVRVAGARARLEVVKMITDDHGEALAELQGMDVDEADTLIQDLDAVRDDVTYFRKTREREAARHRRLIEAAAHQDDAGGEE